MTINKTIGEPTTSNTINYEDEDATWVDSRDKLRCLLVDHYAIRYKEGRVQWPSRFTTKQQQLLPLVSNPTASLKRGRAQMK